MRVESLLAAVMGTENGQAALDGLQTNGTFVGFFDELRRTAPEGQKSPESPMVGCPECGAKVDIVTPALERAHKIITELQLENSALKDDNAQQRVRIKALLREGDHALRRKPEYEAAIRVIDYWHERCMPNAREPHSAKRVKVVIERLAAKPDPYTEEELKRAIDGYAAFPYVVNYRRVPSGSPGQRKSDIELICREPKFVAQGIHLAEEAEHRAQPIPNVTAGASAVVTPSPAPVREVELPRLGDLGTWAIAWAKHGFHVFPTMPRSKQPLAGSRGLLDASRDLERIAKFWEQCPDHNVAVRCGVASCLVVLDVDDRNGGLESLAELEREFGALPRTGTVITPGGGTHYYFRHPEHGEIRNSAGVLGPGLDIRGEGGYALLPPSVGANGRSYETDEAVQRVEMPVWLIKKLAEHQEARAKVGMDWAKWVHDGVSKGARNDQLLRFAGHLWSKGHEPNEVFEIVLGINKARCSPPLSSQECRKLVESVGRMRARQAVQDTGS